RYPRVVHISLYSLLSRPPPRPTLFPYTTLFRSHGVRPGLDAAHDFQAPDRSQYENRQELPYGLFDVIDSFDEGESWPQACLQPQDRKSTRLNSSHVSISYAVFCLKIKKRKSTVN